MKNIQVWLLVTMVILFLVYAGLDIYAWPMSNFAETVRAQMFAIILVLIDPKELIRLIKGVKGEIDNIIDSGKPL